MRRRPLLATPLLVAASGCHHYVELDAREWRPVGNLMGSPMHLGEICPLDLPEGGMIATTGEVDFAALDVADSQTHCYQYKFGSDSDAMKVCAGAPGHCDRCEVVQAVDGAHLKLSIALMPALPGEEPLAEERCKTAGSPSTSTVIDDRSDAHKAIAAQWRTLAAIADHTERREKLLAFILDHDAIWVQDGKRIRPLPELIEALRALSSLEVE